MLPHLVVFDFDGTLADTRSGVSQTMNHVLREAGLPRVDPSFIWGLMGLPLATLIARLIPPTYDASVDALVHAYREAFPTHGEPIIRAFPEVDAVLDELANDGFVLAVATSRARYSVQRLLDQLDLSGRFATVGAGDDPVPGKPAPDLLLSVLSTLGIPSSRALMVGDTTYDLDMARAADVFAVGVAQGCHDAARLQRSSPEALLESLHLLPETARQHRAAYGRQSG